MLEILDPYVHKTIAAQRTERLGASMRAARRASGAGRALVAALMRAPRGRARADLRRAPCSDVAPSRP